MELEELEAGDEVFSVGPHASNFVVLAKDGLFAKLQVVARSKDGSGSRVSLPNFESIPIRDLRFVHKRLTGKLVKFRRDNLHGYSVGTVTREWMASVEIQHPDQTLFTVNRNDVLEFKNEA